ncbi:uncharacterized protein AMSG_09671 [Thecamonas trahens ATCC 50062]|uniref:Uncharacterized protein n=1 Tax=Thecamonas trahens ATCC 50062 TaxID=461836 RepID=A0A0L0DNX5_THETB|nr:hypothetical protein AMSG_09671 [Thecamonas trahens ATCC 50062]KNC54014.1 hypothetical protein AMSG_09671 [Thecamonas trahens ATCC 50062]|eukprot:XP_013754029.1 hypothetical protein AMSG_09671 [Thecamonas trahens ATCC 50062]
MMSMVIATASANYLVTRGYNADVCNGDEVYLAYSSGCSVEQQCRTTGGLYSTTETCSDTTVAPTTTDLVTVAYWSDDKCSVTTGDGPETPARPQVQALHAYDEAHE